MQRSPNLREFESASRNARACERATPSRQIVDLSALIAAFVLALPVAWDREQQRNSAGLRTFPLLAMSACAYVLVANSILGMETDAHARMLQGLATGIGFVGGGAILKSDSRVSGTAIADGSDSPGFGGALGGSIFGPRLGSRTGAGSRRVGASISFLPGRSGRCAGGSGGLISGFGFRERTFMVFLLGSGWVRHAHGCRSGFKTPRVRALGHRPRTGTPPSKESGKRLAP